MDEGNAALNAGGSPDSDGSPDFDNVDGSIQDGAEGSPDEALTTDESADDTKAKAHESSVPYDRFKEVNEKLKDHEGKRAEYERKMASLEGELRAMQQIVARQPGHQQRPGQPAQQQLDHKNITSMTDEEVLEELEKAPLAFIGNLARQLRHETAQHVMETLGKQGHQAKVKSVFDEYAGKNPDMMEMINTGELKKFMDQNPYHNAISAHSFLKAQKLQSQFDAEKQKAIEEAVKKKEADLIKQYQTKGRLGTTLGGAPPPAGKATPDDMLKNPDKYGGKENVLADRLRRFRAARSAA